MNYGRETVEEWRERTVRELKALKAESNLLNSKFLRKQYGDKAYCFILDNYTIAKERLRHLAKLIQKAYSEKEKPPSARILKKFARKFYKELRNREADLERLIELSQNAIWKWEIDA